jgi:Flp pilus assembly protein TadG
MKRLINNISLVRAHKGDSGATLIEFALVAAIFLFFIIGMIDISRYYSAKGILTRSAQNAVSRAKTISGLEVDFERETDTANRQRFITAMNQVLTSANSLATGSLFKTPTTDDSHTLALRPTVLEYFNNAGNQTIQTSAIILRPGDSARIGKLDSNGQFVDEEIIHHPEICSEDFPSCTHPRQATDSIESLYRRAPIVAEMRANIDLMFPGFGSMPVVGRAAAYREVLVRDSFQVEFPPTTINGSSSSSSSSTSSSGSQGSSGNQQSSSSSSSSGPVDPGCQEPAGGCLNGACWNGNTCRCGTCGSGAG